MFSATMTEAVEELIDANFKAPEKISVAVSGTPLENIEQRGYVIPNFNTKVNFLRQLLADRETYSKVLIFVGYKRLADRLFEKLNLEFPEECTVVHSNKSQNYRLRSVRQFADGFCRILVATDVMARGLDIENVSHVINFDTPEYPENYMHRIGRTGRAERKGISLLFTTEKEKEHLEKIQRLMNMEVPQYALPEDVIISTELIPEEQPKVFEINNPNKQTEEAPGPAFHEKKEKNRKVNLGGSYRREVAKKYKKPKTRGDKNANRRKKK